MFKIFFEKSVPDWAGVDRTFSFNFYKNGTGGATESRRFDVHFSQDTEPDCFVANLEDWQNYSVFIDSLNLRDTDTVQVGVVSEDRRHAEFWLTKDEAQRSERNPVPITLALEARTRPSEFAPSDHSVAIFDKTEQRVFLPILLGDNGSLRPNAHEIKVELQRDRKGRAASLYAPSEEQEPQPMAPFPLYRDEDAARHHVGLFYKSNPNAKFKPWPDSYTPGNVTLALGFHSSGLDIPGSPLQTLLMHQKDRTVSNVRIQIVTPRNEKAIWGRQDDKSHGLWITAEDALKDLVVITAEPETGGKRTVVQQIGQEASPIRIIDSFASNVAAAEENNQSVTLFHPGNGRDVKKSVKGSIVDDISNATLKFNLDDHPGDVKTHEVQIALHTFVKRTLMFAIDFGSHSWLATLFVHDHSSNKFTKTEVPIGPTIKKSGINPAEGLSEIVYEGVAYEENGVKSKGTGTQTDFSPGAFAPQSLERRYGVKPANFRVLIGNTRAPDNIGQPTDDRREYYLPYFKSALYRGDDSIEVPNGSGKAKKVPIDEVFRQVFEQVLAEILQNEEVRRKITEACKDLDERETVFGILITHPGFISFETHKRLVETIKEVLKTFYGVDPRSATAAHRKVHHLRDELGLKGNIAEHISLVRAIPEPVAAAMPALEPHKTKWVGCIDVGRRTLDIAVFKPEARPSKASHRLVECWGADLGGQRLDYAILQGLADLLSEDNASKTAFAEYLPLDDNTLKAAFIAQKCRETRRTYLRFQTILRCVEEAKCAVGTSGVHMRMRVSQGQGNWSENDWFDPPGMYALRKVVDGKPGLSLDIDGDETFLQVELEALLETPSIKRFQRAVEQFCESYLFPNGRDERQNMHITVCGRAAQSVFLKPIFEQLTDESGLREIAKGEVAKQRVVEGATQLMAEPQLLLTDEVNLRLSFLELCEDGRILMTHEVINNDSITLSDKTHSVTIAPICPKIAELMKREIEQDPGSQGWWFEATFLDNAIKDPWDVPQSAVVELTVKSEHHAMYRRNVTTWTAGISGKRERAWSFVSHGALNQ